MHAGAVSLEKLCNLTIRLVLKTQHDGVKSQNHACGFVRLGFLPQAFKSRQSSLISPREYGFHNFCPV